MDDAREGDSGQGRADPGVPAAPGADGAGDWDDFRIRQPTRRDANAVVELLAEMLQDMDSYSDLELNEVDQVRAQILERFRGSLEKDDHAFLVAPMAEEGDELVGIVEASVVSPPAVFRPRPLIHIHSLYVQPRWRRQGIGRSLLEEALEWGRARGCAEADLSVLASNPARQVYERLGLQVFELEMRRQV